jgi:subtilisin family serine protease
MKTKATFLRLSLLGVLALALLFEGDGGSSHAASGEQLTPSSASSTAAGSAVGLPSASGKEAATKLESALAQLRDDFRTGGPASAGETARELALPLVGDTVRVIVQAQPGKAATARSLAASLGAEVEGSYGDLVQVRVPLSALDALAAPASVRFVRLPTRHAPMITGQGVTLINADDWQAAGFTGQGVKVAVLDLGFQGYSSLLGSELPMSVTTHSCRADGDITGGGEKHGTGVAEIVHEVAPDAQLYLLNFDTEVELGQCVDWIIGQGVDVINHSVGWFGSGPGNGTGLINDIAANAVSAGVFWANAAGNQAHRHWSGPWQDGDANGWLDFASGDEGNDVYIPSGETIVGILKWDDPFGASCNDYDLFLKRAFAGQVVTSSTGPQDCSQDPVEVVSYTSPLSTNYYFALQRYSANGQATFHLYTFRHNLQYQTPAGSLVEPADNPGVLAVGAVSWSNPSTIEGFSSQGPTDDGRTKPNLVGPDGVSNATYGSFSGTSASSPHAAGAAALVLQANPTWNPAQMRSFLESRAVDLGDTGADNVFGAGRLDLQQPTPTPTPSPTPTATATPTATPTFTVTPSPTATPTATPTPIVDSDGDGCSDQEELGSNPTLGGQRDPLDPWDFYDVPVPTLHAGGSTDNRDKAISIGSDVLAVLDYTGTSEGGPASGLGISYDEDMDGDTVKDGRAYDRSLGTAWSGPPNGSVSIGEDVLLVLDQAGHSCAVF